MDLLPGGIELRFHPDEEHFPAWPDKEERTVVSNACFVNRGEHKFADEIAYTCAGFQFYYRNNPAIGFCGICTRSKALGYHPHDVEGIYILFDPETKQPKHVYFKAHGLGQGVWLLWDECERTSDGALVVYVALHSHASYPADRKYRRIWGFANDLTSDSGRRIRIGKDNMLKAVLREIEGGVRIHDEIPKISNTSISDRERRNLALYREEIRNRARAQFENR